MKDEGARLWGRVRVWVSSGGVFEGEFGEDFGDSGVGVVFVEQVCL